MNKKPIDKNKKSNVKCEHCKYWADTKGFCRNPNSNNFNTRKNYWNRCMQFEWEEKQKALAALAENLKQEISNLNRAELTEQNLACFVFRIQEIIEHQKGEQA